MPAPLYGSLSLQSRHHVIESVFAISFIAIVAVVTEVIFIGEAKVGVIVLVELSDDVFVEQIVQDRVGNLVHQPCVLHVLFIQRRWVLEEVLALLRVQHDFQLDLREDVPGRYGADDVCLELEARRVLFVFRTGWRGVLSEN